MMDLRKLFALGMDREIPPMRVAPQGPQLNLGSGFKRLSRARNLDLPEWDATRDPIPAEDGTIAAVHAYHFLEHLNGEDVIAILREVERVLMRGGVMYIVVPHRLGAMAYQDLDHKSFWTDDTFKNLFANDYYDKDRKGWMLTPRVVVTMGIAERNLALLAQLVKS